MSLQLEAFKGSPGGLPGQCFLGRKEGRWQCQLWSFFLPLHFLHLDGCCPGWWEGQRRSLVRKSRVAPLPHLDVPSLHSQGLHLHSQVSLYLR